MKSRGKEKGRGLVLDNEVCKKHKYVDFAFFRGQEK